jgi:hypothetical protein
MCVIDGECGTDVDVSQAALTVELQSNRVRQPIFPFIVFRPLDSVSRERVVAIPI